MVATSDEVENVANDLDLTDEPEAPEPSEPEAVSVEIPAADVKMPPEVEATIRKIAKEEISKALGHHVV